MNNNLQVLVNEAVSAVCPIVGMSFGDVTDKRTWAFQPATEATPEQIAAAKSAINAFDLTTVDRETAKRKRREVAAKVAAKSDPTLAIVMKALEAIHAEIKAIKEGKARPSKTLAEWQAQILGEFVDDA